VKLVPFRFDFADGCESGERVVIAKPGDFIAARSIFQIWTAERSAKIPATMADTGWRHTLVVAFALAGLACVSQQPKPLRGRLSLPAKNWGVVLDLPGFTLRAVETKPDGRGYMVAENETTHVVVSVTLEQITPEPTATSCRESLEKKTKDAPLKIKDARFSRSGDIDVMEYMVPEFRGQRVNQKSVFACQFHDNTYIDLHVSKVHYVAADEVLFTNVLSSMHIDNVQRSSAELMEQASRLYLQHDYRGAIGPYAEALELEKGNPKLERSLWYVLVDNLGMSYGITGDLQKAKETFDYGVTKDPMYPLFYYNLACTYAELGDATEAGNYLKKAFDYKGNVLPGEAMPDPRKDDSFKKLMKNKEFRELAETLGRSQ
jgi:Tetratricopeptide repeat